MEKLVVLIKNYTVRNRHFVVAKLQDDDIFVAIDHKYIDKNGNVQQHLTGNQIYANTDFEGCLNFVSTSVEMDYLVENGYSKAQAFATVFNMQDRINDIEEIFASAGV